MKYSTILLSAIAASGAMAAPQRGGNPNTEQTPDLQTQTQGGNNKGISGTVSFDNGQNPFTSKDADKLTKFSFGGITTVKTAKTVKLDFSSQLQQKPRCKANDKDGNTFVVQRGQGNEFTFADGQPWQFVLPKNAKTQGAEVAEVICDNTFTKAESQGITVTLATTSKPGQDAVKLQSQKQQTQQVTSDLKVKFVTLTLGPDAFLDNGALRCKIMGMPLDKNGKPMGNEQELEVNRGDNTEKTFGDGFKGAWRLSQISKVTKLQCDPSLKKADPAAPAAGMPDPTQGQNGGMIPDNQNLPSNMEGNNEQNGGAAGTNAPQDLHVLLHTPGDNAAGTIDLSSSAKNTKEVGQFGPEVTTATLSFDETAKKATRCALLGQDGQPVLMTLSTPKDPSKIVYVRNIGGTDEWDVVDPKKGVVSVECDPALQKEEVTPKQGEVPQGFKPSGLAGQPTGTGSQVTGNQQPAVVSKQRQN